MTSVRCHMPAGNLAPPLPPPPNILNLAPPPTPTPQYSKPSYAYGEANAIFFQLPSNLNQPIFCGIKLKEITSQTD